MVEVVDVGWFVTRARMLSVSHYTLMGTIAIGRSHSPVVVDHLKTKATLLIINCFINRQSII